MLSEGWMVNLTMRRVERVTRITSPYNRLDYGKYQGPKRAYMLHNSQVFGTELEAMRALENRMAGIFRELSGKTKRYATELWAVSGAVSMMEKEAIK